MLADRLACHYQAAIAASTSGRFSLAQRVQNRRHWVAECLEHRIGLGVIVMFTAASPQNNISSHWLLQHAPGSAWRGQTLAVARCAFDGSLSIAGSKWLLSIPESRLRSGVHNSRGVGRWRSTWSHTARKGVAQRGRAKRPVARWVSGCRARLGVVDGGAATGTAKEKSAGARSAMAARVADRLLDRGADSLDSGSSSRRAARFSRSRRGRRLTKRSRCSCATRRGSGSDVRPKSDATTGALPCVFAMTG